MKLYCLTLAIACAALCGCNRAATTPAMATKVAPPTGQLVFQPRFQFADGDVTHQGTGFVVAASDGTPVGVTSAHFLDFEGAPMLSAEWLAVLTDEEVFQFTHSLGAPGDGGQVGPTEFDLRRDYFIVVGDENNFAVCKPLELDDRPLPNVGERVWLPNKDPNAKDGHVLVEGKIDEVTRKYIGIELDDELRLQSQSGSPIISQQTGKVIGTLARGATEGGVTYLRLCPTEGIANLIRTETAKIKLQNAVGDPTEVPQPGSTQDP